MVNKKVKYHFSIPDSIFTWTTNMAMLQAMEEHSDWFYDDFVIDSCYGTPPGCIWNGNREILGKRISNKSFEGIVRGYRNFGLKYRLTFTNFLLEQQHLQDEYCNTILRLVNDYGGMVIVSTELMYEYIKVNYPKMGIAWSTTTDFGITEDERLAKINELSEKNILVIPYDFNNKPLMRGMTHSENIEVLVNEMCIDNCPMRREHERRSCLLNLQMTQMYCGCFLHEKKGTPEWQMHSIISRQGLDKYLTLGVHNFKISGRITLEQALGAYLHYFTRKQHWTDLLESIDRSFRFRFSSLGTESTDSRFLQQKYIFAEETTIRICLLAPRTFEEWGRNNDVLW